MTYTKLFVTAVLITLSTADDYRLPTTCSPSHYNVSLTLPSEIFTTESATAYTGSVNITFTVSETVSEILLHASDSHLNVTGVTLTDNGTISTTYNISSNEVNSTTDILTISIATATLKVNVTYFLVLDFDGDLSITDMYGIYKSSYNDSTNITHYLVTTQMEATYARRAFPCFDEPSFKANFTLSLTYPVGLSALGNANVTSNVTSLDGNTTTTVFKPTPKMSTYLVAFVVSDFTCSSGDLIETSLSNQVCSRNETISNRQWALEVTPLVVDSLNSYLSIKYSENMDKLDQVAITDFSAGAMENWGLVTYRERALLYDANETSNAYKQNIASIIAHELAHQWFGNLVTCKWWSEIFLNEGFATFYEFMTTHEILPDYEMDKQFVTKTLQYVFEEDASSTEALVTNASTPSQISSRFGGVTYDKGGSVLRMLEHILGTSVWKVGLNNYLKQHSHASVEPEDLWTVLNASSTTLPTNLSNIMDSWINSPGYPVVFVSVNNSTLTISQSRFVFSNKTSANTTWYIPITFTTSQNTATFEETAPMAWLTPTENASQTVGDLSWILVNNQQTGYYRVNYDANLWSGLSTALKQTNFSGIPEINRAQIVNDALNLARGNYITYTQAFNVTQFLSNETSYHVWYSGYDGFEFLLRRFGENSTLGGAISSHCQNLSSAVVESVPLTLTNASNHIYTLKQVLAQSWACRLGASTCTSTAVTDFASYRNTSVRPNKNLRSIVYKYGLKHSTNISTDWEFLWNAFLNTSLATEQVTILAALGSTSNETILNAYLQKTLTDDSGIRSQDYASVFSAVYTGSSVGIDVALDFFISNHAAITNRYTSMNGVGNILKGIAERLTTNEQIIKLQNFISSNVLASSLQEAGNTALTQAQNNYEWANTHKSELYSYYGLEEPTTAAPTTTTTRTTTTTTTTTTTAAPCTCSAYKANLAIGLMILGLIAIKV